MNNKPITGEAGSLSRITKQWRRRSAIALAATVTVATGLLTTVRAELVHHGVAAGMIRVNNTGLTNDNTAQLSLDFSINDFRVTGGNRADYNVQVGTVRGDDFSTGILMSSVTQNSRLNYGTNQLGASAIAGGAAGYSIVSFSDTEEYNVNVAGAWFPYSQYIGGIIRNASNNAPITTIVGHPDLVFNTHYTPTGNRGIVDLHSFGYDSRTDGVLLVSGGKDENNFGLAQANSTNGTWTIFCKDLGANNAGAFETDPVAFVFVPKTNTHLISGRFYGNGNIDMHSGSSPQFTVTPLSGGRWELKMIGHSPTNGILIISAEGGTSQNQDNIVTYQITAAGDGWEIQSRDTPGNGLQTPGGGSEAVVSFVYIPAASPGFTVTPTNNLLTTEGGGTATFDVSLHSQPKGDVVIAVASDKPQEGAVSTAELTFTTVNWNTPQTVTVTGQDDGDTDGAIAYNIVLSPASSTDSAYAGLDPADVSVVNADNEVGVTVSAVSLSTTEAGGTGTFTVVLNTAPASDVLIGIGSSDTTEGTVAGPVSNTTLFFTPGDWNQPQTVTVTGVEDAIDDGNVGYVIQTGNALSDDPNYNGAIVPDVAVVNIDNDTAGIAISPSSGLVVNESGTTANFTVVLTSEPTANVTVNLASSDLSEGTVSPSTLLFTAANWFTPRNVTLTGANDSTNDGDIDYSVTASVTSSDGVYAPLQQVVSARTVDNEAALSLPSAVMTYSIGTPGTSIEAAATLVDADTANYNGGTLTVSLTANATADDRLEIRSNGSGAGQISVSGNTVSFEGTAIGTFSGGVGTSPLVITLNSSATPAAAQALLRAVTFHNVNNSPSTAPRTVSVVLNDGQGGTSTGTKSIRFRLLRTFSFQEGVDHGLGVYTGAADVEIFGDDRFTSFPTGSSPAGLAISWSGGFSKNAALLRFDNIIGNGQGQIPSNAIVVSADLILNISNSGPGTPLHRMLMSWDANSATWDSMGGGIFTDDSMARSAYDSQVGVVDKSGGTGLGPITFSVTPDVQAWVSGEANFGWAFIGWETMTDNVIFSPSESTDAGIRPHLRVKWLPAGSTVASFRQGVDGYTGTKDTRIGEDNPNADASQNVTVFVDGEANAGEADQVQVLMRFDDIIGSGPGQIPVGATIHAAILQFSSLSNNAPGDGGRFFSLLKPWDETTTWTFWGGRGVVPDGVDALTAPTATAGTADRDPNVPGGYFNFEVTTDVQDWVNNARPNYGWAILPWPLGGDGWGINTANSVEEIARPQLRVYYSPGGGNVAIQMLPLTATPSSVTVRFTGGIGNTYTVQRAQHVTGPWSNLGPATVQGDGTATFIDNAPLSTTAFYRVSNP